MNTKLTLTIDESVIKEAKAYAEKQGRSLSAVVEHFLKAVTSREVKNDDIEITPIVNSLMLNRPKVELPADYDYKKELNKIRDERFKDYLNKK